MVVLRNETNTRVRLYEALLDEEEGKLPFDREDLLNPDFVRKVPDTGSEGVDGEDMDTGYGFLLRNLLPCVIGVKNWHSKCAKDKLSVYATESDEAFCLFYIANSFDTWVKTWEKRRLNRGGPEYKERADQIKIPHPKFTSFHGHVNKRDQSLGWNDEGVAMWNVYMDAVSEARENDDGAFDRWFLENQQNIDGAALNGRGNGKSTAGKRKRKLHMGDFGAGDM